MVPANKILTVAYGTFSCTLEGFDDPFSTMTDIAEYFRDLAADDRFFGAEPPTPDMAMLRTIAEARANRAVDAQPDEGGVTLRPATMPAAAAVATAAGIEPAAESEIEPIAEDSSVEAAIAAADTASEGAETGDIDAPVAVEDTPSDAIEEDDGDTPVIAEDKPDDIVTAEDDDAVEETALEDASAEEETIAPEAGPVGQDDANSADEPTDFVAELDEDSAAAKLARIRDVVAADRGSMDAYGEDENAISSVLSAEPVEDEDTLTAAFEQDAFNTADVAEIAEPSIADSDAAGQDELATDLAAILPDETPSDVAETDDAPVLAEATEEIIAEIEDQADVIAEDAPEAIGKTVEASVASAVADEAEVAPVVAEDAPDADTPAAETSDDSDETVAEADDAADVVAADDSVTDEEAPKPESGAARLFRRIRVRKVRRAEAEVAAATVVPEALAADTADIAAEGEVQDGVSNDADVPEQDDLMAELSAIEAELDRDSTGRETASEQDETGLSEDEDDDAELMAELAAIQAADTPDEDAAAEIEDEVDDAPDTLMAETDGDAIEAEEEEATDGAEAVDDAAPAAQVPADRDMERLFAATDSRFSGEDMSRRHANISHLKAAVAARRADGPSTDASGDETDAYREDLASTVRPHRATKPADAATARPEQRPAPLMLVSEQRVETEAEAEPVRPRRAERVTEDEAREAENLQVASDQTEAKAAPIEDFEQFAADLGAVDLPDILEAAAVYSSKVMGKEHFSRPRLLHLAAEAVDDMSREDGLRGFGQLLRDGTIRKVSRGEFALSADSRYAASADRQAG
ncbi:MAG: hypothetical protein AAGE03_04790 [Pseudomonadota bacterium]